MTPRTAAFVFNGLVLHVGERAHSVRHAVAPVQLLLGIDEPVSVRTEGGEAAQGGCVVIGANVTHTLHADRFALLWVEAHGDAGRRLTREYCQGAPIAAVEVEPLHDLALRAASILEGPSDCDAAWSFATDVVQAVAGGLPRGRVVHPAIRKALRIIEARPQFKVSANELAEAVELSPSRLTHLFREHMGLPLRRFLMWRRVSQAVVLLVQGRPATEVAFEVGFADPAHLNRVLKMMLGIRPSDFLAAPNITLRVCPGPQ